MGEEVCGILLHNGCEVHSKMPGEDEFHKSVIHKLCAGKVRGFIADKV